MKDEYQPRALTRAELDELHKEFEFAVYKEQLSWAEAYGVEFYPEEPKQEGGCLDRIKKVFNPANWYQRD